MIRTGNGMDRGKTVVIRQAFNPIQDPDEARRWMIRP